MRKKSPQQIEINSQIKKPHLKMIPMKDKYWFNYLSPKLCSDDHNEYLDESPLRIVDIVIYLRQVYFTPM